ncbi:MAG: trypsin-like peptidase domain-containing protein [Pirellulales bacterium]|jgi:serine protease Do|nr:trypsin-like peptidase domain-containing protein [Pirellulales bacterium]
MNVPAASPPPPRSQTRTAVLMLGLVILVTLIVWPSLQGRIQYARTRAELAAIRDAAGQAELTSVGKLFTTLVRVVGPAVVQVEASRQIRTLADEINALRGIDSSSATDETLGSGVIVDESGVIVTNYHVVAQADEIGVNLADGRELPATLVGSDAASDLAVLRIDADNLVAATWGDSNDLEVGEMVWAIGNPFGLDRTVTYGIVSGTGRRGVLDNPFQEFLQTDASVNPGNSGGPLVDVHGSIVGITTAIVGRDFRGIGFAIPSVTARTVCEEILANGHVERGYIGISLRSLPTNLDATAGAIVLKVEPGSPAALAGLQEGDLVVGFDGQLVAEPAILVLLLTRAPIGTVVDLDVIRNGASVSIPIRIGRRPTDD